MIAYLEGRLTHLDPALAWLDLTGLGYELRISLQTYSALKEFRKNASQSATDTDQEAIRLLTWVHYTEQGQTLFGFFYPEEKALFLQLISVSGVGPGTAIQILSGLGPAELQQAIVKENTRALQAIKGIGLKTAQRIILDLKDKLKKQPVTTGPLSSTSAAGQVMAERYTTERDEALSALITLGIPKAQAEKTLDQLIARHTDTTVALTTETLIRQALRAGN